VFAGRHEIDGSTKLLGIVGWPLGHTLSPALHNFVLARLGLQHRYVPFPVEDGERLEAALRGLCAAGVVGVNVTIPYKVAAAPLCDELTADARLAGAVNTLRFEGGRIVGHDTDIAGFGRALAERGAVVTERRVLVLGAGGAARAAVVFLHRAGAKVTVAARQRAKGEELAKGLAQSVGAEIGVVDWDDRSAAVKRADVVVNTTPIGMWPRTGDSPLDISAPLGPGHVVYDVVYNPVKTRLLARAAEAGATCLDGLDMLVHQAFDALDFWTGRPTDRRLVRDARRAVEAELAKPKPPAAPAAGR
jgi:shikimate dehydrogenase